MKKTNKQLMSELLGWYGILALMVGYGLVSFSLIKPQGVIFQLLNITGSAGLLIVSIAKKVMQNVLLNIFWIIIGIVTLLSLAISR